MGTYKFIANYQRVLDPSINTVYKAVYMSQANSTVA